MAVVSYSVLAFSPSRLAPQPRNLLPDATPHYPVPRLTSSVTSSCSSCYCTASGVAEGKYMHCEAVSCPSTTCDLLRVSVGELRETSHSICRSVGGNTASVRLLPGQPDACIPGNTHSCYLLLSIEPISNVHPQQSNQRSLPITIAL